MFCAKASEKAYVRRTECDDHPRTSTRVPDRETSLRFPLVLVLLYLRRSAQETIGASRNCLIRKGLNMSSEQENSTPILEAQTADSFRSLDRLRHYALEVDRSQLVRW